MQGAATLQNRLSLENRLNFAEQCSSALSHLPYLSSVQRYHIYPLGSNFDALSRFQFFLDFFYFEYTKRDKKINNEYLKFTKEKIMHDTFVKP